MAKSTVLLVPLLSFLLVFIAFNNPHTGNTSLPVRKRRQIEQETPTEPEAEPEAELKRMVNLVEPLMAILRRRKRSSRAVRRNYLDVDRTSYGYGGGGGCSSCGGCGSCGGGYGEQCCEEDILPLLALIGLASLFLYLVFIAGTTTTKAAAARKRRQLDQMDPVDQMDRMDDYYDWDDG